MSVDELHPYFLGPYGENAELFEKMLMEFIRDHVYWRRNFHPESTPPIPTTAQYTEEYQEFVSTMKHELRKLSADLKKSVPWFSPRYVGHMASDLLLPGVIAKIVTTLYNPNNVVEEASPATLEKELEVGQQLAAMVGYSVSPESGAWGHLTSGGSVANYTGLRNLTAVKLFAPALASASRRSGVFFEQVGPQCKALGEYTPWELANFSVEETVRLRRECLASAREQLAEGDYREFAEVLERERFEQMGAVDFFARHHAISHPVVLVSSAGHYSWQKAMKLLGFGTRNLIELGADEHMRLDVDDLRAVLERCLAEERPVLAVVGILGNTEFGTVDPIGAIAELRREFSERGLDVPMHIDAAFGGYLETVFRARDGSLHARESLREDFKYFPSQPVYDAFASLHEADSITIDPHKLGFIPFPAGAYIAKSRGMIDFLTHSAAYVFDIEDEPSPEDRLRRLGEYILEGSKPGAAAAAADVTHRVIPLDSGGFGRILSQTVRSCEYFFDAVSEFSDRVSDRVNIGVPVEPDTNLVCIAVNPVENTELSEMNQFGRRMFGHLNMDSTKPIQHRDFIVSYTSIDGAKLPDERGQRILSELGVDPATLTTTGEPGTADHIYLLRHTLMNPWLLFEEEGKNYIDRYLDHLEVVIDALLAEQEQRAGS